MNRKKIKIFNQFPSVLKVILSYNLLALNEKKFSRKSKFHRDRDDFLKLSSPHIPESLVAEVEVKQRHV